CLPDDDSLSVWVEEGNAADQFAVYFSIQAAPDTVTIHVGRDGAVLADEELTPVYDEFQPNGEGCSPVCRQGEVELELS
ncbi:MAG TPA: hypothetical protein VN764_07505, partial [Polyangiaceae bacterium]|nr:hypothetical protein [Polyangiaceae bacterium]